MTARPPRSSNGSRSLKRRFSSSRRRTSSAAGKIRQEQKELLDDAKSQGVTKQVVRSVVKTRALESKIAELEANLEDDDRQLFEGIREVLGDFADSPLGMPLWSARKLSRTRPRLPSSRRSRSR